VHNLAPGALVAINLPVGDYVKGHVGGLTFDLNTIWSTLVACGAVLGLGFYVRVKVTAATPNKVQLFWEVLIGWVSEQVETGMGKAYRHVVPLAVTIFILVLACNWVEVFPGLFHNTDYLPSPAADVNLTYALGVVVFVLTNGASIRAKGFGGYIKSFFAPPMWLAPIRALEELMKPITLALRLFGNLFSGGIMIALRGLEGVRPGHRGYPGVYLRPSDHPLLPVRSGQRGPLSSNNNINLNRRN
jgi:F-type H+-transporting ATPase subunit a